MAGYRRAGSVGRELEELEESRGVHGGHTDSRPVGVNSGGQHQSATTGPTLTGWPRSITWNEFRGINSRPKGEKEDAQISVLIIQPTQGIKTKRDHDTDELFLLHYVAKIKVVKRESWAVKSEKTDALLAHEQGHFDITGLAARDMIRELKALRVYTLEELQSEAIRLKLKYKVLGQEISDLYDSLGETDHSRNLADQERWERHIHNLIEKNLPLTAATI